MPTTRKLCYPHPRGVESHALGGAKGLHETSGLASNWALDFMAAGGTTVLAVEAGTVWKCTGHDPSEGVHGGDIYGWNVYLYTRDGVIYFYTHIGERRVSVGDKVTRGQAIGKVGRWPGDPGRSHTHLGCTHPGGKAASKRAILNVNSAPRMADK